MTRFPSSSCSPCFKSQLGLREVEEEMAGSAENLPGTNIDPGEETRDEERSAEEEGNRSFRSCS